MSRYADVQDVPARPRVVRGHRHHHPEAAADAVRERVAARAGGARLVDPRGWLVSLKSKTGEIRRLSANTYREACAARDAAFAEDEALEVAWVMMRPYAPPKRRS